MILPITYTIALTIAVILPYIVFVLLTNKHTKQNIKEKWQDIKVHLKHHETVYASIAVVLLLVIASVVIVMSEK